MNDQVEETQESEEQAGDRRRFIIKLVVAKIAIIGAIAVGVWMAFPSAQT